MNTFSSIITLLLASAAAADHARDIMTQPHIARIVKAVQNADPEAEIPCKAQVKAMFECLGQPCIDCFVAIVKDFDQSTTCESLAADENFCPTLEGCVKQCGENDCTASAEALEACAEENYPDAAANKENPCPDLCKRSEEDDDASEVPAPTRVSSFVTTGNEAHDIVARPHVAKIVSDVQKAEPEADVPCKTEVEDVFECLGDDCINCFVAIIEDLDEDTTCESLKEDDTFCPLIKGCAMECGKNDCAPSAKKLGECAEKNYPDAAAQQEDPCPGLCKESVEDGDSVPSYEIA